jgi:hypothetical protein
MDIACGDKGVDSGVRRVLDGLVGTVNIALDQAGQAADRRFFEQARNCLDRFEILVGGNGKTASMTSTPKSSSCFASSSFSADSCCNRGLFAVPEGGIEYFNCSVHHVNLLTQNGWVGDPSG